MSGILLRMLLLPALVLLATPFPPTPMHIMVFSGLYQCFCLLPELPWATRGFTGGISSLPTFHHGRKGS